MSDCVTVLVTFDLEPRLVQRIWGVDPRITVHYDPSLVGRPRFACDHGGPIDRSPAQEERWQSLLAQSEVLLGMDRSHMDDLLDLAPNLKWIQSASAGVSWLLRSSPIAGSGVRLTTASGIHAVPLSEFTLMAMLMFAKGALHIRAKQEKKEWQRYTGGTLQGKTMAVIGLGSIGRRVAHAGRCAGMRVIGTKRTIEGIDPRALGVECLYLWTDLEPMLTQADYVVVSCPHTAETDGMFDEEALRSIKPGAVLINIARGAIVDEPALIRVLQSGHLGGAALDVTAVEPLPEDSPLWDMPQVLLSPHSGSNVDSENEVLVDLFCENLQRYLDRRPLLNELDRTLWY